MAFDRGKVKSITVEIEYPDGSRKTETVDDPDKVLAIAFAEDQVAPEDLSQFNVSEDDWKQNPAMILIYEGPESIPFCTHNGCKR